MAFRIRELRSRALWGACLNIVAHVWMAMRAPTGVHASQNQPPINASDRVKRGLGLELTISGARPQQNNYLLDGVNINDYANAGPGRVLGGNLGTDAVAEFSVLTTNYSTEYGRTSGGIVTATTKSGPYRDFQHNEPAEFQFTERQSRHSEI